MVNTSYRQSHASPQASSRDVGSLYPDRSSGVPVARQLVQRLRNAIRTGALSEGSRLLPTREFAARIGVSRNTVVAAVDQLVAEGYLVARVGSGTYVARGVLTPAGPPAERPAPRLPASAQRFLELAPTFEFGGSSLAAFRHGIPDINAFPVSAWDRLARRRRTHKARFAYGDKAGTPQLRNALADHLRQFRGLAVRPDDITIVEGAQSAIALVADVMLGPGERVLFEDPCYAMGRAAFTARGATIVPVEIGDDGLDAAHAPEARLAYVTPSHQYPLGGTMSAERRAALLGWAHAHDAYIVEDDYDGEFRFAGTPLPALQGADANGRVIYVGTFSKVLAPGLRIGFLVTPPHLTPAFRAARATSSLGASALTQLVLADFVAEGYLARHVRRMTAEYQRRAHCLTTLLRPLRDRLTVGPATGGLHLTVRAAEPLDDVAVARAARESGLFLHPLSAECIARRDVTGFVLGFGMARCDEMPAAVETLISTLARFTATP